MMPETSKDMIPIGDALEVEYSEDDWGGGHGRVLEKHKCDTTPTITLLGALMSLD